MSHTTAPPQPGFPTTKPFESPKPVLVIPKMLDPTNPHRPPDWRWQRIGHLEKHDPDRHYLWSDPWRKRVWQMRQMEYLSVAQDDIHRLPYAINTAHGMVPRYPPICPYVRMGHRVSLGHDAKNLIEAFALAGVPAAAIARRLSPVPAAVVQAYLALFFDIQDRLQNRQFILGTVLQFDPTLCLSQEEPYQLWREVGYLAGEACLRILTAPCIVENELSSTSIQEYFDPQNQVPLLMQDIIQERLLPDYERSEEYLRKLYLRLLEIPYQQPQAGPLEVNYSAAQTLLCSA